MINFSVIIPLYNKQETIEATIHSVLNQSYKHFELIVVNDGSTDNSLEIVRTIQDERIKIINKSNTGVSDSRNAGIQAAKYDWIALLDGDDIKHPNALKEISLQIKAFPSKNVISTGYSIVNPNSQTRYVNRYLPDDGKVGVIDYIDCISSSEPPINSSNSAIRRSLLINSGGFVKGQRNYEDHELWLRIYIENDIVFINKDLLSIRRDLAGTARQNIISVKDLSCYLKTIIATKNKLKGQKLFQFKKFYYLYSLYIFNVIRKHYCKQELQQILGLMKKLISWPVYFGLQILSFSTLKEN